MDNNQGQNQSGQEGWINASESNNGYTQSQYNGSYTQQQYNYQPQGQDTPGRGYAIASMVLGICGIVFCCCYGMIGIICSVLALIMHHNAVKMDGFESSYAKVGKICGIIGIALGAITLILSVFVMLLKFPISTYTKVLGV